MAARKPIVLNSGRFEQLQAGDTLDAATSEVDVVTKTNDNAGNIVIGQPVYVKSNGNVDRARANASGTIYATIGLVRDATVATGQPAVIQTDGVLVATTTQWDTVTGQSGGLTPGTTYYVGADDAGVLRVTPPSATGEFVMQVGIALSSTELEITFGPIVKL